MKVNESEISVTLLLQDEYDEFSPKIEAAARKSFPSSDLTCELAVFSNMECRNHSTIVKVIWEKKGHSSDGIPHLVYISREKRPQHMHHFKAGAMNVLVRAMFLIQ
ncbi:hypothetical protein Patl1_01976 [Pistacia atlantica]|uniref:Uncharacterized protein n=1 Tax=Pistacia atlantica TaxID=434234 RepID=A0ACC1C6F7_9ROSI|nr:hypothetical protein Patl1_01976 [Pistacia atlantica]